MKPAFSSVAVCLIAASAHGQGITDRFANPAPPDLSQPVQGDFPLRVEPTLRPNLAVESFSRIDQQADGVVSPNLTGTGPGRARPVYRGEPSAESLAKNGQGGVYDGAPPIDDLLLSRREMLQRPRLLDAPVSLPSQAHPPSSAAATILAASAAQGANPVLQTTPTQTVQPLVGGPVTTALAPGAAGSPPAAVSLTNAGSSPLEQRFAQVFALPAVPESFVRFAAEGTPRGGPPLPGSNPLRTYAFVQSKAWADGEGRPDPGGAIPRDPTMLDVTATLTSPDGRTSPAFNQTTYTGRGLVTAYWNDPAFPAAVAVQGDVAPDGSLTIWPLVTYDERRSYGVQGVQIASGNTAVATLPDGSTLRVTASARRPTEAEAQTARRALATTPPPPPAPPPPHGEP